MSKERVARGSGAFWRDQMSPSRPGAWLDLALGARRELWPLLDGKGRV